MPGFRFPAALLPEDFPDERDASANEQGYSRAVAEHIFEPLGMTRSFASYPAQPDANTASGYSTGAAVPGWTFDALAGAVHELILRQAGEHGAARVTARPND